MTLLELLVQELPKRGGWPEGALYVCREIDGTPRIVGPVWHDNKSLSTFKVSGDKEMVDISQYEAALAALQKLELDVTGLPPVGAYCEITDPDGVLIYGQDESGEVVAHVENTAVIRMSYGLGCFESRFLRPIRSEADKKRDEAVSAMFYALPPDKVPGKDIREAIYDAIAAGKIPGVRIE